MALFVQHFVTRVKKVANDVGPSRVQKRAWYILVADVEDFHEHRRSTTVTHLRRLIVFSSKYLERTYRDSTHFPREDTQAAGVFLATCSNTVRPSFASHVIVLRNMGSPGIFISSLYLLSRLFAPRVYLNLCDVQRKGRIKSCLSSIRTLTFIHLNSALLTVVNTADQQ